MGEEKKDAGSKLVKKRYLSGYIDLGILGKKEIYIFKNEDRQEEKQPDFRIFIKEDSWIEVGALWVKEFKSEKNKADEILNHDK